MIVNPDMEGRDGAQGDIGLKSIGLFGLVQRAASTTNWWLIDTVFSLEFLSRSEHVLLVGPVGWQELSGVDGHIDLP